MIDNISIYDLTFLDKRMYRCGIEVQEFEKNFINSLIKNAKFCTNGIKIFGDVTDSCNRDVVLYLSEKQMKIFDKIRIRYKNAYDNRDAYHVYAQIIEDYEISLDDYDRETLESFKEEKEDEGSKEWMRQIMLYR